ncbi:MAG TPA: helix-turn-helix domain-containing protein [Thermoleophilaceae bacterium]
MAAATPITAPAELGALIRRERTAQGILQEDLALAAGTGRRFIIELERGKPTVRLAEVLAVLHTLGLGIQIERARGAQAADV